MKVTSKWCSKVLRLGMLVALLGFCGVMNVKADTLIASQTNDYLRATGHVSILSQVFDQGGVDYLWKYTVTNFTYNPGGINTNGFSGFELALPGGFPADLGNVTDPGPGWVHNCCSGRPEEWDKVFASGLGIMPGGTGVFSFTTLPREIDTARDGWFHTWMRGDSQVFIEFYGASNAPLAPNLLRPPVPEPGTLSLVGLGGLALIRRLRREKRA